MDAFEEACVLVQQGHSILQSAKICGVNEGTLRRYMKKNGVVSEGQKILKKSADQKKKIIALRASGMSYSEIARQTNVGISAVRKCASHIILPAEQLKRNLRADIDKQKKAVEYRKEGMYITEIARKLNCSKGSVHLWLQNHVMQHGDDLGSACQERKEFERSLQISKPHPLTNTVIEKRKQGMSFPEISVELKISSKRAHDIIKKANLSEKELLEAKRNLKKRQRYLLDNGVIKPRGGDRINSGWSKTGYYKGIYCGSTYELCWVIHAMDHGVQFKRFEGVLKKDGVTYIPDFLLDDGITIIELKGYDVRENVNKKTKLAESLGYKVNVLREQELQPIFDYVKKHYGVSWQKSYTLFDGFKPTYTYECTTCCKTFSTENKRPMKNGTVFCSGSCSATHRNAQNKTNPQSKATTTQFKSKLSQEDIVKVFYASGTYASIAEQYNISQSSVGFIKNKKIHKSITEHL